MTKKEKTRTCIVTRKAMNCDEMIRFVVGPQDEVVADLKQKLPGRGVWVINSRQAVQSAIERKLFAAGFKKKVNVTVEILAVIEGLLLAKVAHGLSMAKKSGLVITGFAKVSALARNGDTKILFHASDGRDDGVGKIKSALVACQSNGGYNKGLPPIFNALSSSQLDVALGMSNSVHVALIQGGATRSVKKQISRFETYCA
ncbi:MAG: RNA-binding protein [Rhizobiaceae bacterium]|nr:RNA-binding protein [Rhizobiaceae bacterium]